MCVLSHVRLFSTQWTVARQAPLSMGFSRQEYWSGLPFPPPGDLPIPGFKLVSPAQLMGSLPLSPWGALRPPTDEATACALHIEGEITADMQRTSFLGVELPPVFPALDWLRSDPPEGVCCDGLFLSSWAAGSPFCSDAVNHVHFPSRFYLLSHSDFRPILKLSNYQPLKRPVPAQILGPWADSFILLQERARQSILC